MDNEPYIFRDGRRKRAVCELTLELSRRLRELPAHPAIDDLVDLLLRAGELECALHDSALWSAADVLQNMSGLEITALPPLVAAEQLTDALAEAFLALENPGRFDRERLVACASALIDCLPSHGTVTLSTPEGFAYYALHPLDFADLVERADVASQVALVIGIRSIGTTLSAVVAARLRQRGIDASRLTVRPAGHPYDRRCEFSGAQLRRIREAHQRNGRFVICDEGPGRSGSSLLSVGEALEREGTVPGDIVFFCSHDPAPGSLCARDAAARWSRYKVLALDDAKRLPDDAGEWLGGGEWRRRFLAAGERWPGAWTALEPRKYLAGDGDAIYKFEGYGLYGERIRRRARLLSEAGFAPPLLGHNLGFGKQALLRGRVGRRGDLSPELIRRMAQYCAFRAGNFTVRDVDSAELENMVRVNLSREFDCEAESVNLQVEHPVIADGRMQPHEWLLAGEEWKKLDATMHGDDHFFPGPCDVAWDLAGAIVEWQMPSDARELLVAEYEKVTGDRVRERLGAYELAYAVFRCAWTKTASHAMCRTIDKKLLEEEYLGYRAQVAAMVEQRVSVAR